MWRAFLAAIVTGVSLTVANAQVSPLPANTFMASPCGTTGNLAPRVPCAADISAILASPPPIGSTAANTGAFSTLSATGLSSLNGGIIVNNNIPGLILNKTASGQTGYINGQTAGVLRWQMGFGNATAESGSNVGSDFELDAFSDTGILRGTPILVTRSTLAVTISNALNVNNIVSTEFPGLTSNNQATGFPGMDGSITAPGLVNFFMSNTVAVTATNATAATLRIDRTTTGTGGSNGLNPNALTVNLTPSANDAYFEYGISGVLFNYSLTTTSSQNVALAGSAFKKGASAVSSTWAVYGQIQDQTGVANPTAGTIGAEFDAGVNAVNGGTDTNKQRLILQLVGTGSSGTHIGQGITLSVNASGDIIDTGIRFNGAVASTFGIGIDFSTANSFSTTAIMLSGALQQAVSWQNAAGTYTGGSAGSAIYKTLGNVLNFDNWDNGTFLFENNAGLGIKFVVGHLAANTSAPAPSACGGGSPAITGSDLAFIITEGTTATGCVATFQTAFTAAPKCIVTSPNAVPFTSFSVSATALTIINPSASGDVFNAICVGV